MNFERIIKTEIQPLNSTNSGFSFADGNPNIVFQLSKTMGLLDLRSLKFNYTYQITSSASPLPNNNNLKTGGAVEYNMDLYTGLGGMIRQINIATADGTQIESIRNYAQMLKLMAVVHSEGDYNSSVQNKFGVSPYDKVMQSTLNQKQDVSLELVSGVLSMDRFYPLNAQDLQITIELSTDTNVLFGANAVADTPVYRLSNVGMTYDVYRPDVEGQIILEKAVEGDFSYNSLTSIYNIVNSSDATTDISLNDKRVRSVISTLIPTSYINTYSENGMKMTRPENTASETRVQAVEFKKNGVNFPYDEAIDVRQESVALRPQTGILKEFISSVIPLTEHRSTLMRLRNATSKLDANETLDIVGNIDNILKNVASQSIYGVGVNFDSATDVGSDFTNSTFSKRFQSGLDGSKPMSVYSNVVSRNEVLYDAGSISVSS